MKVLTWYTTILVAWVILYTFAEMVGGNSADITTDIYGIAAWIPVLVLMILNLIKGK